MKKHGLLIIGILAFCGSGLHAEEKPWKPDMGYAVDRRLSASEPITSPWEFSKEAERAEYQMLYLLEAHKDATLLALNLRHKGGDVSITQEQRNQLNHVVGNLSEVVRTSFSDVTPFFLTKMNSTLLLMMLYHYEVYCYGGDSSESWPVIIKPLQDLDPVITAKAKELAKKGIEGRNRINQ